MLFYSAVHYANAYIWERYHVEPGNHDERSHGVRHDTAISRCYTSYGTRRNTGFYARYAETYRVSAQRARELLDVELRAVEATVMQALGQPVPVW